MVKITKNEIRKRIADLIGVRYETASTVLQCSIDFIIKEVIDGKTFRLAGHGHLYYCRHEERIGQNIRKGGAIVIAPRNVIKLRKHSSNSRKPKVKSLKPDFIQHIRIKTGLTENNANIVYGILPNMLNEILECDGKIFIRGFGTFSVQTNMRKKHRNPLTGEVLMNLEPRKYIHFKPGKEFKVKLPQIESI